MATRRMPGTGVPSCRAMARPVAPAPTMPTRIGLPVRLALQKSGIDDSYGSLFRKDVLFSACSPGPLHQGPVAVLL